MIILENANLSCSFDSISGQLCQVRRDGLNLPFTGFSFDFGCDGKMVNDLLRYESMLEFRTWNLPDIKPTGKRFALSPVSVEPEKDQLTVTYRLPMAQVQVCYALKARFLKVDMALTNLTQAPLYLNTCAFMLGLDVAENVVFDFPANAPIHHCHSAELAELEPVQTGLINFATHTRLSGGDLNLLFIDMTEKWGCGAYRSGNTTHYVYNAGLEVDLYPGETCQVGSLYIAPCAPADGNPYLQIRSIVEELGFEATQDGIHDGVMYSCHPSGTMDAGFPLKDDLYQYAEYLPKLKEMGINHVWLLPVFDHNEHGVYHSNDQSVIHERYGGEEGCKYYCDKAHELGMTILFDYVPHGPAPEFPVARDNPEWPSKRRDGSLQDEWECVSMDYNHPGYQEYTARLVHDHVRRFGVDGSRIDCAMGGLSNWRPYKDNRPSGNSVLAGVHITEAIREGFLRGGKRSFILPENFNPLPNYYHCTDLFYSMNLYRAFVELEGLLHTDPGQYVQLLADFLEREALITPENYHKLRFLGNHDTVSWVWQCKRAVDCYGTDGAKMLFALICLIDGVPMLYQGDEDPTIYGHEGENLTEYFTMLLHHRKQWIPQGNVTEYLKTDNGVFAFIRRPGKASDSPYATQGTDPVLVLINLSSEPQAVPVFDGQVVAQSAPGQSQAADPLPGYSYRMVKL